MAKSKFSITKLDAATVALTEQTDHRTLGVWAKACAERVLPYFEQERSDDPRPRQALVTLQAWIDTGIFKMAVIRKASLDSHAAAREVGADNPARSAARAAGQAVATAHVRTHCMGGAILRLAGRPPGDDRGGGRRSGDRCRRGPRAGLAVPTVGGVGESRGGVRER
ncbi:MAG: hypothetical protein IPK19_23870 [Chloroflexi bacterium]|nr:hypothetical protein [Chloroflexota bacterium]